MGPALIVLTAASLSQAVAKGRGSDALPWKVNPPIVTVERTLIGKHAEPKTSVWVSVDYVGPGLVREERRSVMLRSDTPERPRRRRSKDNGRTWSSYEPLPDVVTHPKGVRVYWDGGSRVHDPASKLLVSIWLRQTHHKGVYYNQLFSRCSRDNGQTWSTPRQLTYEPGETFDLADPFRPGFLNNNQAYPGNNTLRHSNGTLIHVGATVNIPKDVPVPNPKRVAVGGIPADSRAIGSLCFVGRWSPGAKDYDWVGGKPVWLPRHVVSRGLMEPEVAELTDGRLLVVWRGSNAGLDPKSAPGRKWYSVSTDGGMTLSKPKALTYDDGSGFYSPSSFHRMIRHSVTGKLYWVGNVCPGLSRGNSPRYPLVIAEVDERVPALKRSTVTAIDDRRPGESDRLQLSNFSLFEDRETHVLEIYLTRLGADPKDFWGSDAYKYTLRLR